MKVAMSVTELIGNTPLLKLNNFARINNLKCDIYAKLEYFNPAGSAKDRVALNMLFEAEKNGKVNKNSVIIEPTSGNTGIGLAAICASCGYRSIFVMPDSMSIERRKLISAYGAEIVLTPASEGMAGSVKRAKELANEYKDSFIPSQFDNPDNPGAHYKTTGPEIWRDTEGELDIFVAGIGTGGTLSGTGKYLKEQNSNIKIVGYEPASSPFLTEQRAGKHKIQGIGAGFKPSNFNENICDELLTVTDDDAINTAKAFAKCEGVLVGISSGGALAAALALAQREENYGKKIVVLLPDTGERYLSTELFI